MSSYPLGKDTTTTGYSIKKVVSCRTQLRPLTQRAKGKWKHGQLNLVCSSILGIFWTHLTKGNPEKHIHSDQRSVGGLNISLTRRTTLNFSRHCYRPARRIVNKRYLSLG